jgi:hypothetical protein
MLFQLNNLYILFDILRVMTTDKKHQYKQIAILVFLVLNILFGVYIAFIKTDVYSLETLKAGGRENMNMAIQLYSSDVYKQQQKTTLEQILGSMNPEQIPAEENSTGALELPIIDQ